MKNITQIHYARSGNFRNTSLNGSQTGPRTQDASRVIGQTEATAASFPQRPSLSAGDVNNCTGKERELGRSILSLELL